MYTPEYKVKLVKQYNVYPVFFMLFSAHTCTYYFNTENDVMQGRGGRDSRVVSVLGLKCRGSGFESRCGQRNLAMELVNIYLVLSCSFVEIMRLCVSVCIN